MSVGAYIYVVMASLGQSVALLEGCRGGLAVSGTESVFGLFVPPREY